MVAEVQGNSTPLNIVSLTLLPEASVNTHTGVVNQQVQLRLESHELCCCALDALEALQIQF